MAKTKASNAPSTSPAPHRLTVFLATLGPLVATLALGISYGSYLTAREALQVANQSLVALENGRIEVFPGGAKAAMFRDIGPLEPNTDTLQDVLIYFSFDAINLGKSPAALTELDVEYAAASGWTLGRTRSDVSAEPTDGRRPKVPSEEVLKRIAFGNIGQVLPGSRITRRFGLEVKLSPDAIASFLAKYGGQKLLKIAPEKTFRIIGRVTYTDPFAARAAEWCWDLSVGSVYPRECVERFSTVSAGVW